MSRLEALERVAEAAREIADQLLLAEMTIEDRCDADVEGAYDAMIERMRPLIFALDTLPPEPSGDVVEVELWAHADGDVAVLVRGSAISQDWATNRYRTRLGSTRLVLAKEETP